MCQQEADSTEKANSVNQKTVDNNEETKETVGNYIVVGRRAPEDVQTPPQPPLPALQGEEVFATAPPRREDVGSGSNENVVVGGGREGGNPEKARPEMVEVISQETQTDGLGDEEDSAGPDRIPRARLLQQYLRFRVEKEALRAELEAVRQEHAKELTRQEEKWFRFAAEQWRACNERLERAGRCICRSFTPEAMRGPSWEVEGERKESVPTRVRLIKSCLESELDRHVLRHITRK